MTIRSSTDGVVATIANAHSGECKMSPSEDKERAIEIHRETSSDVMVSSGIHGESMPMAIEEAKQAEAAEADVLMPISINIYSHGDPEIITEYSETSSTPSISLNCLSVQQLR